MKAKKFFVLLIVLLLSSLVLGACQPAAEVTEEPEVTEPEVTEPEVAEPETTEPEVTEPEVTEPEEPGFLWTKNLRQAIAAAIDREEIVDRVFEGRNVPAYHMVPDGYPYATQPFFDKYGTRDLDLAIQLLSDEGYTEDSKFVFDLWYPPEHYGTTTADVMQVIKEQLEET